MHDVLLAANVRRALHMHGCKRRAHAVRGIHRDAWFRLAEQVVHPMHHLARSCRWFSAAHLRVVFLAVNALALAVLGTL
jgi:hypothetical protein